MILVNLFYRGISYFVLPFLGQEQVHDDYSLIWLCIIIFNFFISLAFLKWLDYDFTNLRREILDKAFQKSLTKINWIMGAYYLVIQNLSYFEYEQGIQSKTVRHLILVFYLLFFMGIIKKLDTYLKEKLHERLDQEQALRYRDIERYSRHIEELYKEVRSFRHDYSNLLTSLRLGIEEEDMEQIKEVYDSVLKDSSEKLQDNKYDLGRLVNIRDKALKSCLLYTSFFEVPYLNFEPRYQSFRTPEIKLFQVFSLRRKVFDLVMKRWMSCLNYDVLLM